MIFLTITIQFISCKKDVKSTSVITEVYEVDGDASDNYAKVNLKYMEQENFNNNSATSKTIYNAAQSVK